MTQELVCSKCGEPLCELDGRLLVKESVYFTCVKCEELSVRNSLYLSETGQSIELVSKHISKQEVDDHLEHREKSIQDQWEN